MTPLLAQFNDLYRVVFVSGQEIHIPADHLHSTGAQYQLRDDKRHVLYGFPSSSVAWIARADLPAGLTTLEAVEIWRMGRPYAAAPAPEPAAAS